MPLVRSHDGSGYRGVELDGTKLGYVTVRTSHNKHRFNDTSEARRFIDDLIDREAYSYYGFLNRANSDRK
jgi:hypothetical protein